MAGKYRDVAIRLSLENTEKVKETLRGLGTDGMKALRQIEKAAEPPSKALMALNDVMAPVNDNIKSLMSNAGSVGTALSRFGASGAAAAAGVGAIAWAFIEGTKALLEAEKAHKRLESVLQATGNTAGLTAAQIEEFSGQLSKATGIQDEAITAAAGTLAAFRSVSGDVFKETIEQASNLSAVFGGDLDSNVQALGKAMEMLAGGQAEGLRKAFKALTVAQEAHIKALAESGRGIEAQRALLQALEETVGGAAEKTASMASKIAASWEDLLKRLGNTGPIKYVGEVLLKDLEVANALLEKKSNNQQINDLYKEQNELMSAGLGDIPAYMRSAEKRWRAERIAEITKEISALEALQEAERGKQRAAEAAAAQQQRENELAQAVAAESKEMEEQKKEALATAKREAEERVRATQAIDDQIKALKDEREGLALNDRQRFIHNELIKAENEARRANMQLTPTKRNEIIDAAGKDFDAKQAQKEHNDELEKGRQITQRYAVQVENLNRLLQEGAIDQKTYDLAARDAWRKDLERRTDGEAGALRAFDDYQRKAADTAAGVEQLFSDAMKGTDDALTEMVTSGSFKLEKFGDLAESIFSDLTRMLIQKNITTPLFSALSGSMGEGGFLSSIFSSILHEGGTAGDGSPSRAVPAYAFVGAPRYHSGGIAGLAPDEVPAILQRGEVVSPRGAKLGTNVSVNIINNAGAEVSTQRRTVDGVETIDVLVDKAVASKLSQRGSKSSQALRNTYGANGRLISR